MSHTHHSNSNNPAAPMNRRSTGAFSSNRNNQVGASLVKKDSSHDLLDNEEMNSFRKARVDNTNSSNNGVPGSGGSVPTTRKSVKPQSSTRKLRNSNVNDDGNQSNYLRSEAAMEVVEDEDSEQEYDKGPSKPYVSVKIEGAAPKSNSNLTITSSEKARAASFEESTEGVTNRDNASSSSNQKAMVPSGNLLPTSFLPPSSLSAHAFLPPPPATKDKILAAKEKNREHAKNTRLRKKNYIESLKKSIKELSEEREKVERDKSDAVNKVMEQTTDRRRILQEVINYRCSNVHDEKLWSELLDESIVLVLPITPYRSFPPNEVYEGQRIIKGIDGMILDTASIDLMLQSTVVPFMQDNIKVQAEMTCNFQDSVMSGDTLMCKWDFCTKNAMVCGCRSEIVVHGMLKAIFSPNTNKITYLEEIFDVMSMMQQLRRAAGRTDFNVIPNTLALAHEANPECRIVVELQAPYPIIFVNDSWCTHFGIPSEEILQRDIDSVLELVHNNIPVDEEYLATIHSYLESALPYVVFLPTYIEKDNQKYRIFLRMYPLYVKGGTPNNVLIVMERGSIDQSPFPSFNFSELPLSLQYEAQMESASHESDSNHTPTSGTTREEETDSISMSSMAKNPNYQLPSNSPVMMTNQMMDTDYITQQNTSEEFIFGLLHDFTKESSGNLDSMGFEFDQPSFR